MEAAKHREMETFEVESLAHNLQQGVRNSYAAYAKRKYYRAGRRRQAGRDTVNRRRSRACEGKRRTEERIRLYGEAEPPLG